MSDILPTRYKFIYATLIKVSMLTREKMLQVVSSASTKTRSAFSQSAVKCLVTYTLKHSHRTKPLQLNHTVISSIDLMKCLKKKGALSIVRV